MRSPRLVPLLLVAGILALAACSNEAHDQPGDKPADAGAPSALGTGLTMREVNTPGSDAAPVNNQANVGVTGVSFLIKDEFSETGLASGAGDIYVQDFYGGGPDGGGAPPYSGMLLYKATLVPASLQLAPGDVVDLLGIYQQYSSTSFPAGAFQPEMDEPIVTFRFDYAPPTPTVIPIGDLADYSTGFKWLSMLVTVKDTYGGNFIPDSAGRCGIFLTSNTGQSGLTADNEFFDLDCTASQYNPTDGGLVHFKSITGIVTYFINFHISPRTPDDIVIGD